VLHRLLRSLGRRSPTPVDFRAIPLPPREYDDGRELVIVNPDGTRLHLPSRLTRIVPQPSPPPPRRPLRPSEVLRQAAERRQHDGTRTP
jgi:hypothetical protein